MEISLVLLLTVNGFLIVDSIMKTRRINKVLKAYNQSLTDYKRMIDLYLDQSDDHRELMKFSIKAILNIAVKEEDYETAQACMNILDKIDKE